MKRSFTLLLFPALFSAQPISVSEENEHFSGGSHPCIATTIYQNSLSDVMSEWKKVLKDLKNEKVKDSGNEIFGDNIVIKEWGNNSCDFYTKFSEDSKAKEIKMYLAVDLGGNYLSHTVDKEKANHLEKMVRTFAVKMTKAPIEEQYKAAQKAVLKSEDKLKDLENEKKELQKDIEKYKEKTVKAEKEGIEKSAALEKKKEEVRTQKKVVDASKDAVSEQAKSSKKILEKLEEQQKDLEKDIKDLKKDIENYKEKVAKAEKDIKQNEEDQVKKKKEIEDQKKLEEDWKKKLDKVN